jgi:hypothetical protein
MTLSRILDLPEAVHNLQKDQDGIITLENTRMKGAWKAVLFLTHHETFPDFYLQRNIMKWSWDHVLTWGYRRDHNVDHTVNCESFASVLFLRMHCQTQT